MYISQIAVFTYSTKRFGKCRVSFHCHYFQVLGHGSVLPEGLTSLGQIEIFNHYIYLKPFKYLTDVKLNYSTYIALPGIILLSANE